MIKATLFSGLFLISALSYSQKANSTAVGPKTTDAKSRIESYQKRKLSEENSIGQNIRFRNVGPTVMSGRVTDIEVDPNDATHFYVAYASGGLWETTNNGTSFSPLFDHEMVMGIGDIAIDWKNKIIWVGTGENNSSRSTYSGVGIYKSSDNGKSWTHSGLEESQHISRIVLHPSDPNTVWVGVIGHLFSFNKERGMYKTTDGGKTWTQTLYVNEKTGIIDVTLDPNDPKILYASAWQRERVAWNFTEAGAGSGIYKSTDGGDSWKLMTDGKNGFPIGEGTGRIGLAVSKANSKVIYAFLDNQNRRPIVDDGVMAKIKPPLLKEDLRKMTKEEFLAFPKEQVQDFLKENDFPEKYNYENVIKLIKKDKIKPIALVEYLEDANSLLFDTPVVGAELYKSEDGGATWKKTHQGFMDDIVYTYGYYFGNIRVDEKDENKVYIVAFVLIKSEDGGKTFTSINGDNQHVDHHALCLDPNRKGHLINGNDGGVNISYDDGKTWIKCNSPAVGQFYTVNVDYEESYNVYGGLQDNGVWWGNSTYTASSYWHQSGQYPYKNLLGGDGMQVVIDPRDNETVYTGYQFGHYFRMNKNTGTMQYITPKHELGEKPYRWNWQSPIWMSVHNNDVIYFGANKLFRSFKMGDEFKSISNDLTNGGKKGDVAYGTLTTIHESPMKFGLLYTGSDDGLVYVTKDGGSNWTNISSGLPSGYWIRRVQASAFSEGRVYVVLNGHTFDDMSSLVFVSEDFGKNWKKIGINLPMEPVNVIREDPENENLIFIGTDQGVYFSLDKGVTFQNMDKELPHVAVHDMVIQQEAHDLVIGTHGRSIWIAHISELERMNDSIRDTEIYVYDDASANFSKHWGTKPDFWSEAKDPEVRFSYYVKEPSDLYVRIKSWGGTVLYAETLKAKKGINHYDYSLQIESNYKDAFTKELWDQMDSAKPEYLPEVAENGKYYLIPGTYDVEFTVNGKKVNKSLDINVRK
jgi:photosystem II stability/assembly factor-like uncharacterized protein